MQAESFTCSEYIMDELQENCHNGDTGANFFKAYNMPKKLVEIIADVPGPDDSNFSDDDDDESESISTEKVMAESEEAWYHLHPEFVDEVGKSPLDKNKDEDKKINEKSALLCRSCYIPVASFQSNYGEYKKGANLDRPYLKMRPKNSIAAGNNVINKIHSHFSSYHFTFYS